MLMFSAWRKIVEVTTGISIPHEAQIGAGLYIGHFGTIILHPDVRIGQRCTIMQGVSIGLSWGKGHHGVPIIGDDVYVGPNAFVGGSITVGDGASIGANSVVTRDVAPGTMVRGVPAERIGEPGHSEPETDDTTGGGD